MLFLKPVSATKLWMKVLKWCGFHLCVRFRLYVGKCWLLSIEWAVVDLFIHWWNWFPLGLNRNHRETNGIKFMKAFKHFVSERMLLHRSTRVSCYFFYSWLNPLDRSKGNSNNWPFLHWLNFRMREHRCRYFYIVFVNAKLKWLFNTIRIIISN